MEQYKLWSASSRKSVQPLALDILKYKYCPEHPSICVIPSTCETKFYTDTKKTCKITMSYILVLMNLDSTQDDKIVWTVC
jgi:hypothetical protein